MEELIRKYTQQDYPRLSTIEYYIVQIIHKCSCNNLYNNHIYIDTNTYVKKPSFIISHKNEIYI